MRGAFVAAAAVAGLFITPVLAQQATDGHPDLSGFWTNGTATPLQRPDALKDTSHFTPEEARAFEAGGLDRLLADIPNEDKVTAADLNTTYLETHEMRVLADLRTSLIVDPANGKRPELAATASTNARTPPHDNYDNPEGLDLNERCLLGTVSGASAAAPPMIPNPFGQNFYQIVQTPAYVMILAELVHDARIIRIGGTHLPPSARQWLGDSIGHWEGDTLVVDTTNYTSKSRFLGSGTRLHVVERFTRVNADTIGYRATVEDPDTWTAPWTVDIPFTAAPVGPLDYECHESNYSLEFSLRGQRAAEAAASK